MWSILCGEEDHDVMSPGLGGVLLESTDWAGGLRDRVLVSHGERREAVEAAVDSTIETVKANLFAIHGLST